MGHRRTPSGAVNRRGGRRGADLLLERFWNRFLKQVEQRAHTLRHHLLLGCLADAGRFSSDVVSLGVQSLPFIFLDARHIRLHVAAVAFYRVCRHSKVPFGWRDISSVLARSGKFALSKGEAFARRFATSIVAPGTAARTHNQLRPCRG